MPSIEAVEDGLDRTTSTYSVEAAKEEFNRLDAIGRRREPLETLRRYGATCRSNREQLENFRSGRGSRNGRGWIHQERMRQDSVIATTETALRLRTRKAEAFDENRHSCNALPRSSP